ncbi:sel1 repeat family protein [Acetobacteraceae bacterium]|nr:sel1 repeat family protein [Acetobacteraceae bacterium]
MSSSSPSEYKPPKRKRADRKNFARAEKLLTEGDLTQAFSLFSALAMKGDAEAEWQVGKSYLSGKAVPYSLGDALYWVRLSAEQGFPPACLTFAYLYLEGFPPSLLEHKQQHFSHLSEESSPNYEKARFWGQKAAEAGEHNAQAFLGSLLLREKNHKKNDAQEAHSEAVGWLERSIEGGSALGNLEHGRQLLSEGGYLETAEVSLAKKPITEKFRQGVAYLETALEKGVASAALLLGWMRLFGPEAFQDLKKGVVLLERAAQEGFSQAHYHLGIFYTHNHADFPQDFLKAESYLKQALKGEVALAGYALGRLYEVELPQENQDKAIAMRFYHEAALLKHLPSIHRLSEMFVVGIPEKKIKPDLRKSAFWLSRASALGSLQAQGEFGNLLLGGVSVPEAEGEAWRTALAEEAAKGGEESAYNLALAYLDGIGGKKDPTLARHYFGQVSDAFPEAAYQYAKMLFEGQGGERDLQKARIFFEKAAQAGQVEGTLALAQMLLVVPEIKDHPRALRLYHQAAEAGSIDAMFSLGAMYGGGHEVPMDRFKARYWFLEGAERGNPLAQYMAGRYYLRGLGGERDLEKASLWLKKALQNGVQEAQELFQAVERERAILSAKNT